MLKRYRLNVLFKLSCPRQQNHGNTTYYLQINNSLILSELFFMIGILGGQCMQY